MSGRNCEAECGQYSLAPGAAPGIIIRDKDEWREALPIPRAPPAAWLAPTFRAVPPV
jgi:hypothetical protein